MADNRTSIVITARDEASGPIARVGASIDKLSGAGAGLGALKTALGGLAGAFSVGALISFAKSTIDAADNINDLSQKLGISVKDLAGWQLAAEQSGASLESIARGVKGLAKNMVDYSGALKAAGIDAKTADGAMVQLADLFAAMPDGVEKTTLAVELFGKAGMDMIPMLNLGSKGLADAKNKAAAYAEKLAELAPKADEFNDSLSELGVNAKAAWINGMQPMVEGLNGLMALFKDATSGAKGLGVALGYLADKTDSELIGAMAGLANQRATGSGVQNAARGVKSGWDLIVPQGATPGAAAPAGDSAAQARADALLKALGKGGGAAKGGAAKFTQSQDFLDAQQAALAGQSGLSARDVVASMHAEERALDDLRRRYIEMIDPLQKYRDQLGEIDALFAAGALTDDQRIEAIWRINEAMDAEIDKTHDLGAETVKTNDFARDLGLTFSSAFEDAIVGGKSLSDVLKGLEQDLVRIALRKLVTEPLANAFGGGGDMVGDFFKGIFGGARAAGGPVTAGSAYLVGERGPELFMPSQSGSILPNGAGGVSVHNTFTIQGSTDRRSQQQIAAEVGAAVDRAMRRNR